MRFTEFEISGVLQHVGIADSTMSRLGQVVALFGPNGAGKSRLLSLVMAKALERKRARSDLARQITDLEGEVASLIESAKREARNLERWIPALDAKQELLCEAELSANGVEVVEAFKLSVRVAQERVTSHQESRRSLSAKADAAKAHLATLRSKLQGTSGTLIDLTIPPDHPPEFGESSGNAIGSTLSDYPSLSNYAEDVRSASTPLLECIVRGELDATNEKIADASVQAHRALYCLAQKLFADLMSMKFSYEYSKEGLAVPLLNDRKLQFGELSPGQQRIMYYLCLALEQARANLGDNGWHGITGALVVIDEPEVHLHPRVLPRFVATLRDMVGSDGQIWLATHSVSLLPTLAPEEVWTIDGGVVSPPSAEQTGRALRLLVGSEDEVDAFRRCMSRPDRAAAAMFAAQCIEPPSVAGHGGVDPQMDQFRKAIWDCIEPGGEGRVLDLGSGRGRLLAALRGRIPAGKLQKLEFWATEREDSLRDEILEVAGDLLTSERLLKTHQEIRSELHGTFSIVVLCNVLHEIEPVAWRSELDAALALLSPNGSLVILEDQQMPVGEHAHPWGFVVLGAPELASLFQLDAVPKTVAHASPRYRDRLLCAIIPGATASVDQASVRSSVGNLRARLMMRIAEVASAGTGQSARVGREYALLTQMAINCERALDVL